MSADSKPHSELFAAIDSGIRSTGDTKIGSTARYQARAALRSLEEQLEATQATLRRIIEEANKSQEVIPPMNDDYAYFDGRREAAQEALNASSPASEPGVS